MSGNGGNAAGNAAGKEPANIMARREPWVRPAGPLGRPHPNSPEYIAWVSNLLDKPAPPGYVKFVMQSGMNLKHAVNAYIGSEWLDPRCRQASCSYHGFGEEAVTFCPRGLGGSGKQRLLYARGVLYLTSDPTRASRYAAEAGVNVNEDKTNGAVLTVVVIVPSNKVFYTTEDEVRQTYDRNAWWEHDGYSMLVVTDSIGRHVTNESGYDAAVMDLSLVNIIRCHPCYSGGIDAEYGLVYTENKDGIIVTDATKAAEIGIFATPEMVDSARSVSQLSWDVYDRTLENVSVLCFAPHPSF